MNNITATDLHRLVSVNDQHCISLYMPTHPVGREGQQDALRLKNLAIEAEQQLIHRGTRSSVASELMKPILDLCHHPEWERRNEGLATFRSETYFSSYWLTVPVEEAVLIGRQFYVKRLLPATCEVSPFFVLAVSRDQVRLLKVTGQEFERVHLKSLPKSMELALNLQGSDRGEQMHSGMRGNLGKQAAVFHGQGGHCDTLKSEVASYFRLIDESLRPLLRQCPWPLVLGGVAYELAIFREVSSYRHIAYAELHGCFDHVDDHALYLKALPIAQQLLGNRRTQAITRYRNLAGTNHASNVIESIVRAAYEGRIETLLADPRGEVFGRFHSETDTVDFIPDTDPAFDLVEASISQTILHRGSVYALRREALPSRRALRAIFRY
jgi:hypothetical protein